MSVTQDDQEYIKELHKTFQLFDKDGSNSISASELVKVWRSMGQNPTEEEVEEMLRLIDKDESGTLSWDEFLQLLGSNLVKSKEEMESNLREAFKYFDKDGNGFVDALELKWAMGTFGSPLTNDEVDEMIKMVDADNDGRLNYEEFVQGFMS